MSQFLGNTVAAFSAIVGGLNLTIQDEARDDRTTGRYYWDYQQRCPQSTRDQCSFFSLWVSSKQMGGDPNAGITNILGSDVSDGATGNIASFEWWSYGESGTLRPYYIRGQCIDLNGNPLPGATVSALIPNALAGQPDIWVAESISDTQGMYAVPSVYRTSPHYLVAYLPGSPDVAGTTVNTITPSL